MSESALGCGNSIACYGITRCRWIAGYCFIIHNARYATYSSSNRLKLCNVTWGLMYAMNATPVYGDWLTGVNQMDLWNTDTPINQIEGLDVDVPSWIDQDITPADVAAIVQGGCASGAYMPAVTYHQALDTMNDYGDDVLGYIEDTLGELPSVRGQAWAQMACTYLSTAVEIWATGVHDELESFEPEQVEA